LAAGSRERFGAFACRIFGRQPRLTNKLARRFVIGGAVKIRKAHRYVLE
jgi:hypothetical protein